ncbi:MAG: AI-2E family transporter [Rhodobacteraceae bacterium]|nr:AI-2E family transporter [Paracoccaceae bacterium]
MGLSTNKQLKWWGISAIMLVLVFWVLGGAFLPYIAAAAIAYFLDPVADRLEKIGLSRLWATIVISTITAMLVFLAVLLVLPLLIDQLMGLAKAAPDLVAQFQKWLGERFPQLFVEDSMLRRGLLSLQNLLKDQSLMLVNGVLNSSLAVFDFLILLVITPVVSFYLLLDWDKLVAKIDSWLPREHLETIRGLASNIDRVLAGFVRGQITVSAILGSFYAISLVLIGLQFGAVIGLVAGLISFIPFVGSIIGGSLSIGVAVFQFWDDPIWIGVVAAIFIIGQFFEGNILSPKLVGGSVGLHPVWLMFSLSAFGALLGFVGLLIAVPVSASIGVIGRFLMERYMEGPLFKGPEKPEDE